jgi:DNA-binding beta-propeller fold protein YncE
MLNRFHFFQLRKHKMSTGVQGIQGQIGPQGIQGSTDGTGTNASFNSPTGIAVDSAGTVYVADQSNNRIRRITPGGVVSTLAGSTSGSIDGTGTNATFWGPVGIIVDLSGTLYVTDQNNHLIRKITPAGVVTTLAGQDGFGSADGTGANARFISPRGVAVNSAGTVLYVADSNNHRIRKIV